MRNERSAIESVFSAVKRLYGSGVKSRSPELQEKEVILKFMLYVVRISQRQNLKPNCSSYIFLIVITVKVFYKTIFRRYRKH